MAQQLGSAISFILPCLNEHDAVAKVAAAIRERYPDAEIVVVDDGSDPPIRLDPNVRVIRHPYRIGNGAAIKTGARNATGDVVVCMDADGQHNPQDIPRLLEKFADGYDMVVGAREVTTHATRGRRVANLVFNRLASLMIGHRIDDLTSGFRAMRARAFRNFLYLLPNGFSYPATSTMAFFRCGYTVAYVPIKALPRSGKSKIRSLRDGLRFLVIIMRIGALFSPMRFFLPLSLLIFAAASILYGYTYITMHRFTNMSAVLYLSSLFTLLFGIVSEQVSALHYRYSEERRRWTDRAGDAVTAALERRGAGRGETG